MPITPDEFKREKVKGSLEDLVLDLLSDGNAYTQSEIEKELGIGQRNINILKNATDNQKIIAELESLRSVLDSWKFWEKLEDMEKAGHIRSAYIEGKDGSKNKYYIEN